MLMPWSIGKCFYLSFVSARALLAIALVPPTHAYRPHLQIINMISKSLDHVYAVVHWQVLQSTPSPPPLASPAFALAPPTPAI